MTVYKLAGKDGKGAWFARRSVHEGLGFEKWKKGLQREFPKTMEVHGGPGEGNIRGIGAERRVERRVVESVGTAEGESYCAGRDMIQIQKSPVVTVCFKQQLLMPLP